MLRRSIDRRTPENLIKQQRTQYGQKFSYSQNEYPATGIRPEPRYFSGQPTRYGPNRPPNPRKPACSRLKTTLARLLLCACGILKTNISQNTRI